MIDIKKNTEIRQSNIITSARYDMTACELDLFFCLLSQLKKEDKQGTIYLLYVKDIESITGRAWNYAQLQEATHTLISRVYEYRIPTNKNYLQLSLFSSCEYIAGKGLLEVEISEKMRPHLIDLKENFTSYRLLASLNMKSKYAKRIYMLCARWKDIGSFKMTIEELKISLHLKDPKGKEPEQYKKISQLKERVLEIAKKEINEYSELKVNYQLIKRGRAFEEIEFTVNYQKPTQQIPMNFQNDVEFQKIKSMCNEFDITKDDYIIAISQNADLKKRFYRWVYSFKTGKLKNIQSPSGHLLRALGLA